MCVHTRLYLVIERTLKTFEATALDYFLKGV